MPTNAREMQAEAPILLAWGLPSGDLPESFGEGVAWWATAGASLLAWTALALVLTS
jgi:hypothetical protein